MKIDFSGISKYEACAAGAAETLGAGKIGDVIQTLVVCVSTSGANGTCTIKDGSDSAITVVPASTPIGTYVLDLNIRSRTGAWVVTTGSAATALAIGRF